MAVTRNDELEYIDLTAMAQRTLAVDSGGNPLSGAVRTTGISRVNTATTTNIAANLRSFSVTVVAASSGSSPTLGGVPLPAGYTANYAADGANLLNAGTTPLVTAAGDDVIIITVV
jgi:hypothetical protein